MSKVAIVSDLHLHSPRSDIGQSPARFLNLFAQAEHIVLNGDIFDLHWGYSSSFEQSVVLATQVIQSWLNDYAKSNFYYVLGNHDSHPELVRALERIAQENSRLKVFEFHFELGDCIFIHGDLFQDDQTCQQISEHRSKFHSSHIRPKESWAKLLYSLLIESHLHKLGPLSHSIQKDCRRIFSYLQTNCPQALSLPKRIYFGHTHLPFSAYKYAGHTFSNTGSGIRKLWFEPLLIEI